MVDTPKDHVDECVVGPTDEALAHMEARQEPTSFVAGAKKRYRRLDSSELDRLFLRGHLTQDEHHTLELFQSDLMRVGLVFCPRAGFIPSSTSGHAQFISDAAFARVKMIGGKMGVLHEAIGKKAAGLVVGALINDEPVPKKLSHIASDAAKALMPLYDWTRRTTGQGQPE